MKNNQKVIIRFLVITLLFAFYIPGQLFAQSGVKDSLNIPALHFSGWYHHGYLFPHHRSMAFYNTDNINGVELFLSGFRPNVITKLPSQFGVGYYFSNLGNLEVYGRVHSIYAAITSDFCRSRLPIYFQQTTALGLSYNTEHFDINKNYANRAIGSSLNVFAAVSVDLVAEINDKLSILAGPSVLHTSNGNIKKPNYGLNLVNARFGIKYKLNSESREKEIVQIDNLDLKKNKIQLFASGSVRQLSRNLPQHFFVGSLIFEYNRRVNQFQALGAGLDFIYDPTIRRETYIFENSLDMLVPWHIGIHVTWERIWNNFSIVLQPGYKILTLSKHDVMHFYRAGIRYRVDNQLIIIGAIKAHKFKGDFIELGMGYEF